MARALRLKSCQHHQTSQNPVATAVGVCAYTIAGASCGGLSMRVGCHRTAAISCRSMRRFGEDREVESEAVLVVRQHFGVTAFWGLGTMSDWKCDMRRLEVWHAKGVEFSTLLLTLLL